MATILAFTNQKGGVGKTTTAINIAYGLSHKGKRVLVCDLDSQWNSTYSMLGVRHEGDSVTDVLTGHAEIKDAILPSEKAYVDILPSDRRLLAAERVLTAELETGPQTILKRELNKVSDRYDYIILDCPPAMNLTTIMALAAADAAIIPIKPGTFSLTGAGDLLDVIEKTRNGFGSMELGILGFIINFSDNTLVNRDTVSLLNSKFPGKLFDTMIPKNVAIEEAHRADVDLYHYKPTSTGATAFALLTEEVVSRVEEI